MEVLRCAKLKLRTMVVVVVVVVAGYLFLGYTKIRLLYKHGQCLRVVLSITVMLLTESKGGEDTIKHYNDDN